MPVDVAEVQYGVGDDTSSSSIVLSHEKAPRDGRQPERRHSPR
jgi:hypothetical protein